MKMSKKYAAMMAAALLVSGAHVVANANSYMYTYSKEVTINKGVLTKGTAVDKNDAAVAEGSSLKVAGYEDTKGDYGHFFWDNATITSTDFKNNKITSNGPNAGAAYFYTHKNVKNQRQVTISDSNFVSNVIETTGTNANTYSSAKAGAVLIKGAVVALNNVGFTGNEANASEQSAAMGGGIYMDATLNDNYNHEAVANFNISKDMVYSGNKVSGGDTYGDSWGNYYHTTAGGFLYMDRWSTANFNINEGAELKIGKDGETDSKTDSIASAVRGTGTLYENTINKTGKGVLTVNGSMNGYHGDLNVKEGTMNVNSSWASDGKTVVSDGATLNVKALTLNTGATTIQALIPGGTVLNTVNVLEKSGSLTVASGATVTADTITLNGKSSVTTAAGSTLTAKDITVKAGSVNAAGTVTADNVIANKDTTVSFTGGATINKNLKADGGAITLAGDALQVYKVGGKIITSNNGTVALAGGTLEDDAIASKIEGTLELKDSGILSTKSDQIYTYAASETAKDSGAVKTENIKYTGGTLKLTDEKYTLDYSSKAKAALKDKGATTLVMAGQLVTEQGEIKEEIGVDDASNVGDEVQLDQVTAKAEENLLVGSIDSSAKGEIDGVNVKEQVATGFAVASLELPKAKDANATVGVVITNAQNVTLGGSAGGDVITVTGDTEQNKTNVKVVIGTDEQVAGTETTVGTLTIGNKLATADTKYTLNGEAVINAGSALTVNGQTEITKSVTLNNAAVVVNDGAKLTTETLVVGAVKEGEEAKKSASTLTGAAAVKAVTIGDKAVLNIGSSEKAGELKVADITGGMVFLDPAYADSVEKGSGLALAGTTINTALVAGQNSRISVGAELADADSAFAKTGLTWGSDVSAAAYIANGVTLGEKGSLTVNGDLQAAPTAPTAGSVTFAKNSLLMVDGAQVTKTAAMSDVKSTTIDAGSTLFIDNAKKGETYKILAGEGLSQKWEDAKVISSNALLKFEADTDIKATAKEETKAEETAEVTEASAVAVAETAATDETSAATENTYLNYKAAVQSVKNVYGSAVIAPNVIDAAANGDGDAYDFVMNKAVQSDVNATTAAQVSALNSVAAMTELAGAAHGTYAVNSLFTDAVVDHMTLANERTHDKDVWAKYIHSEEDIGGLALAGSGAGYDAQYNGIVVGADVYKGDKSTVGVALTYADGNISGNTLAAHTKNDAKYYGFSVYGGVENGDSALLGDITYLHGKNDITQWNSTETITGSVKTDAFSIGVRGEKKIKAGEGQLVPYIGLRYMHLSNGSYTNSLGMAYDGDDLNLWLLPVGVKYSVDFKGKSWTLRPVAEVGYVWNMGDRDGKETIRLGTASDSFGYDVTDSGSYIARLAVEAEKDNTTFGIGYEYQKGDSVKANRWTASVNYRF